MLTQINDSFVFSVDSRFPLWLRRSDSRVNVRSTTHRFGRVALNHRVDQLFRGDPVENSQDCGRGGFSMVGVKHRL